MVRELESRGEPQNAQRLAEVAIQRAQAHDDLRLAQAERDELERLAVAMAEGIEDAEPYFDATVMGLTRQGREIANHLRCSLAAFNVHQRKNTQEEKE